MLIDYWYGTKLMKSIIGVDFDNTIICYDAVFHRVALEQKLIPAGIRESKNSIRNYFCEIGQENKWTELQGHVYGTRMNEAILYPGVIDFFVTAMKKKWPIYIISHKTRYPYRGPQYDLHHAAREWLNANRFFESDYIGLKPEQVFFEQSIHEKIKKIEMMECSYFIDDLPELFSHKQFPAQVKKIHFCSYMKTNEREYHEYNAEPYCAFKSWQDIIHYLLSLECAYDS